MRHFELVYRGYTPSASLPCLSDCGVQTTGIMYEVAGLDDNIYLVVLRCNKCYGLRSNLFTDYGNGHLKCVAQIEEIE